MKNTITYLKKIPSAKLFFGGALFITGFFTFLFSNLIAGLFIVGVGLSLLTTEGSQINIENNTYRLIRSIFSLHIGKWKPCPEFEYICIFKTIESQKINAVASSKTIKSNAIFINLFFKNRKHITIYKSDNKKEAIKVANHFKLALGVDILDSTEKEKIWL